MSAHGNGRIAERFNEAFNARDWDGAVGLCTPDVELVTVATAQALQGSEGVTQFLQGWTTAFPDGRVETTRVIADERGAVIEFTGTGTHAGPLQSPAGDIPATGKAITLQFCQYLELTGGKIARARLYFDSMSMLGQLGLLPAPGR